MGFVVRLGLRGLLLGFGTVLFGMLGGLHYRWLLFRNRQRSP